MQVSFTGFKNAGYLTVANIGEEPVEVYQSNIQLTDDKDGKDLTEFKNVLRKTGGNFINPINKDFVNIECVSSPNTDEYGEDGVERFLLLNQQEVEVCDENLPIFSFLAKLTRNIAKKPLNDFVVNKDYLTSDDCRYGVMSGADMVDIVGEESYKPVVEMIHEPERVVSGAKMQNSFIQSVMMDYFA